MSLRRPVRFRHCPVRTLILPLLFFLPSLGLIQGVTGWHPLDGEETPAPGYQSSTVMRDQLVSFFSLDYTFSF